MLKIFFILLLIILLNGCSNDYKKVFLKNKNISESKKKISELKFDNNLSFDQFRNNVIEYGKLSNFPKLDK